MKIAARRRLAVGVVATTSALMAGVLIAPIATRLRGLYLSIVTLGLQYHGEHIFREWSDLTGGAGVGRLGGLRLRCGWGTQLGEEGRDDLVRAFTAAGIADVLQLS